MKLKLSKIIVYILLFQPYFAYAELSSILFVDTYSAESKNDVNTSSRPYYTQASENSDYHLNIATAGLKYDDKLFRANLIGQFGESVDINYSSEPDDNLRFIQESFFGIYFNENTSLDIGTFLAHIGAESWLSKDNINYTRSLIAEYSPYYETGARLSHKFNENLSGQLLILNGWQNTTDNRHPALGTQINWNKDNLNIISNTFLGKENYETRIFHDLIISKTFDSYTLMGSVDVGYQGDSSFWWGYSLMGKKVLTSKISVNARIESYQDPDNAIASTLNGKDFDLYGASLGVDFKLINGITVRTEVKQLYSNDKILKDNNTQVSNDTLYIISLNFFDERKY